jgi:preprotein translocase subunit SecG
VDTFTLVSTVLVVAFFVTVILLGAFSRRSARDILDWKPTRSPQVEAENEQDDIEQMVAAQNELRRRRGKPERSLEDIESEWRGS